jgi:hypothetical protein
MSDANRKPLVGTAESKNLCMRGNSLHGNRETLETPPPQGGGRSEKDDFDPREFYPMIDKAMAEDDAKDPLLESYQ